MAREVFESVGTGFLKFTAFLNGVATIWTFLLMFLMTGDVLARTLFNHPLTGTPELVKVSIVGIVFLSIPHTLWAGRHIRSEIFLSRFNPLSREIFEAIVCFVGAAMFVGIIVSSWSLTVTSWQILEYEGEGALPVPTYPIRTLIILGSFLTAAIFLYRSVESCQKIVRIVKEEA